MSDTFKLPDGSIIIEDENEEVVDEVVKDKDLQLQDTTEVIKELEEREEPIGLDTLKEKGILSEDNITGTLTEETVRGFSKIIDKVQGKEVDEDVSLVESLTGAGISAGIKIPKGLVTFGTLLYDITQEEGIPYDETLTGKLTEAFEQTTLGKIEQAASDVAAETAAGKITEAIGQLYGAGKIAQKTAIPVIAKTSQKVRQLVSSIKSGRYVKTTNNLNAARAVKEANKLNKITGKDKFIAIAIGGGVGGGFIVSDVENIGTFGDWDFLDFLPTGLDRNEREQGAEDAKRQLLNRLKFGAELGFPIIPAVVGTGKIGKLILQKGKDLTYSDSMLERWVDRFVGRPFRSRSNKTQELFDGIQKLEGKKSAIKVLAKDAAADFDDTIRAISKETRGAAQAIKDPEGMSKIISEFMFTSTDDIVKGKSIAFPGFSSKALKTFTEAMEKLGVSKQSIKKIVNDSTAFRNTTAGLKSLISASKNVTVGTEKLNKILNERIKNQLSVDYKIIDDNRGLFNGFRPAAESIKEVAQVLQRYARANRKTLDDETANKLVTDITKNAFKDKTTGALVFDIGEQSALADKAVQRVNIGKYITTGKFKPDGAGGLIQTKSDLQAFKDLFGEYRNAQKGIYAVASELGETIARDKFYQTLLDDSNRIAAAIKQGNPDVIRGQIGRPIFFKNYNDAVVSLPNQTISKTPLSLKTALPDTIYKSPLDGYFTTVPYGEAIRIGDAVAGSALTRSAIYRALMLIPKGLSQAAKTILGPFTHARNFFSSMFTTIHRGNILIPPGKIVEFLNRSRKSVQPQLLYRMTGNPKYRNAPPDQALYRFLLEEGVTNQNIVARELEGIFSDITQLRTANMTTDKWFNKILNTGTRKFKRLYDVAQDLYTAEDDLFRVYNFLAEFYKLDNAFNVAIKKGIKDINGKVVTQATKPSELELMKEAAQIVRETVPNYAYVSDFVKGVRRSPLGSFAAFPAEIYRTGVNTTTRALFEIKDPIRKQIGFNSLVGQAATYTAIPVIATEAFRLLYGITRDQVNALREVLPTWSEDNTILPVYENGKYKYIDFSHGFFYDTMIEPVQTTLSTVQRDLDKPLVPLLLDSMVKSTGKIFQPFIQESIWIGTVLDIFARKGKTKEGRQIWNERDEPGDKFSAAIEYAAKELSPGSREQLIRLYKALTDQTVKGTKYEIPDELMGLFGFRKVPVNLEKTLNFRIQEFNRDTRSERNLIFADTRTGDPVKDDNIIIKQFVKANQQRYETYSKMRRLYDAVKVLGMRDKKIGEEFADRNALRLYGFIENNRFDPFNVSSDVIAAYAKESEERDIPNPLNRRVLKKLEKMRKDMSKLKLNEEFNIDVEKYLLPEADTSMVPPLPETPAPNVSVAQAAPNTMTTGLTPVEQALLSEEEKMILLKDRGMA